ncbi:nicotinate phosphoribosyltransferase [Cellulomonas sp. zg-ZUI22]|uniref:nicotinate phosphoribosyltransferase n=1 Tax=Cellulomonas sp. zg-ZUI22 TaxID=2816955 RepID=UPI001A93EF80|nr:nicotinate phosphoribosyltransferase [Cellulomonas sp. zg-ZUI22]MBO0899399.1 nicotinate phosphoribosyltransferase [Cellulomonas sp. zg-ZUI22]
MVNMTTTTTVGATSTAMLTDHYELTMLRAALADGTAHHQAVFEAFARRLPDGRRYGVVAGLGRIVEAIESFTFDTSRVAWLLERGIIDERTADHLLGYRFTGNIDAYREGDIYFPNSPVLTVSGTFAECVVLETLILSILNHDSAMASAAARMVSAADGRPLLEMGSRRTNESAAVAAARAAYIAGFASTSNLQAGFQYGVPTRGTAAHAFTLGHTSEREAFASQVASLGTDTTLLVDTYDIPQGIRTAVEAAGTNLGGIRLDSGDLGDEARKARALLDSLGATSTKISVTSDLDEHTIAALADAPIDLYGAGTKLVGGSGHPTAGMVYKLVAIADEPGPYAPMRPVAKKATSKGSVGGRKVAYRALDHQGHATREVVVVRHLPGAPETGLGRALQVAVIRDGHVVHRPSLAEIRAHHRGAKAELTALDLDLAPGTPRLVADPTAIGNLIGAAV